MDESSRGRASAVTWWEDHGVSGGCGWRERDASTVGLEESIVGLC